ncbi:MAG: UDP-N-acetylmuramoyl-L-alanyl-D-glutamate--2,6-diaminopimelate ligase [Microbacteriaceae bacterium]|nr:UDP-N-acetylmuramoyl-L-alanyl-D-glutamate--2,6-diaminopimelate ligase [Microbacteriaceae bacterium]
MPPVLRPEYPEARPLDQLISHFSLDFSGDIGAVAVTGVTLRSTEVQPGDLYVGVPGANSHGADFADDARAAGAVAMVTDAAGSLRESPVGFPVLVTTSPRALLGELSAWVYRTRENVPQLFGVTGTNGKTSTAYILEAILRQLGVVTGLSSTAERHIGDLTVVSRLTTPEASEMHALLARMQESDVSAAAIEVSAQALSRNRVDGIFFDVVAFTNLSHDHLDDYETMDEYFEAKAALFDPARGGRGVVSLDSSYGNRLAEASQIPVTTISSLPTTPGDWNVQIDEERAEWTGFTLRGPEGQSFSTRVPLIGRHMAANAGLAIVMLVEAGYPFATIAEQLGSSGIRAYLPGRTERVSGETGPAVFVDFGHSPDAFLNTLAAVRTFTTGRVIMVFGADGDRDATKRHEMGRVASEGSDILVVTDHHPRFEDPESIRATLVEGASLAEHQAELFQVSPPEQAIRRAVSLARDGDTILWAGPGHQDYRDIRGVRTPYSARAEAREALREAGW